MAKSSTVVKKAKTVTAKPEKKPVKSKPVKVTKRSTPKKKAVKAPAKKIAPKKKAVAKKAVTKKAAVKPIASTRKKKQISQKKTRSTKLPVKSSLPPNAELSEELVEKAANAGKDNNSQMILPGSETPLKTEDPLKAFDKHTAEKAMVKGDPRHKFQFSQTNRRQIKPSGKKPLWRK